MSCQSPPGIKIWECSWSPFHATQEAAKSFPFLHALCCCITAKTCTRCLWPPAVQLCRAEVAPGGGPVSGLQRDAVCVLYQSKYRGPKQVHPASLPTSLGSASCCAISNELHPHKGCQQLRLPVSYYSSSATCSGCGEASGSDTTLHHCR